MRKTIGAYAALMGGLDRVVFTGGIGEHAASVRERICDGLEFLDVQFDVIETQEERVDESLPVWCSHVDVLGVQFSSEGGSGFAAPFAWSA